MASIQKNLIILTCLLSLSCGGDEVPDVRPEFDFSEYDKCVKDEHRPISEPFVKVNYCDDD